MKIIKTETTITIRLEEYFTFRQYQEFRNLLNKDLYDCHINRIVFNMTAVKYMDSSALGMLLTLIDKLEEYNVKQNINIYLINCQINVKKMLECSNFNRFMDIM